MTPDDAFSFLMAHYGQKSRAATQRIVYVELARRLVRENDS